MPERPPTQEGRELLDKLDDAVRNLEGLPRLVTVIKLIPALRALAEEGLESRRKLDLLKFANEAGDKIISTLHVQRNSQAERIATLEQQLEAEQGFRDKAEQSAIVAREGLMRHSRNADQLCRELEALKYNSRREIETSQAELTAAKERIAELQKVLGDATGILRIALEGMPNGAFRNAVLEEEMPRFERMAIQDGGTADGQKR